MTILKISLGSRYIVLKLFKQNDRPFGGIVIMFGDWRQTTCCNKRWDMDYIQPSTEILRWELNVKSNRIID